MKKILAFLILFLLVFIACSGQKGKPLPPDRSDFAGKWEAENGDWIRISNNGRGDFRIRSFNVEGGHAVFRNDSLEITLFDTERKWKVSKKCYRKANGQKAIELNGREFIEVDNNKD
ncbi:MAG: hypothetical protein ACLFSQ_09000 [Candidatus Zixiibacteriota bacterium]